MKRSLYALAAACVLAVSASATWAVEAARSVWVFTRGAWDFAGDCFGKLLTGPAPVAEAGEMKPRTYLLAARSFHQRLVKRERPVISQDWRMCPSV
jgi:hypothetical protein